MRTTTQDLKREQWAAYFNALNCGAQVSDGSTPAVTVEVIGERPDSQQGAARWRLRTIAYKLEDDVLEIAVRGCGVGGRLGLRHFIACPRAITLIGSAPLHLTTIVVDDASGIRTRIRLFAGPQSSFEQPPRAQARDRAACRPTGISCAARDVRRLRASPRVHRARGFS